MVVRTSGRADDAPGVSHDEALLLCSRLTNKNTRAAQDRALAALICERRVDAQGDLPSLDHGLWLVIRTFVWRVDLGSS